MVTVIDDREGDIYEKWARLPKHGFHLLNRACRDRAVVAGGGTLFATMAAFVSSPFGASLRGTRDQPRRMTALGYNVWLIRFLAFLFSGFWCAIAGLLYLYNNRFISPQASALQASAEVLLMVISGGTATLLGPIAGATIVVVTKYIVSAYVVRWNLVLGVIFVAIISFMPEGLVPGSVRIWGFVRQRWHARQRARKTLSGGPP